MSELRRLLSLESLSMGLIIRELERGSNPNAVSCDEGVSAMHLAAGLGKEVTGYLIQYGGDPNISHFRKAGLDPTISSSAEGSVQSDLQMLLSCLFEECIVTLRPRPVDASRQWSKDIPSAGTREGLTPLHVSASYGDLETLTLLLHNGANANLQDEDGNRPLDLAMENGHPLCIEELKTHTMLASVEECSGYQYFGQNQEGCHSFNGHQTYFDNSCIDPEVLVNNYAKTITQDLYDRLSEGKNICFDVTSPTTPLIGLKKSCCKPCCNCDEDIRTCPLHKMVKSSKQGHDYRSYSPRREHCECNHPHHSSPTLSQRFAYMSPSPHRVNVGSDCCSHSSVSGNQGSSTLTSPAQRLSHNHNSPCRLHSTQLDNFDSSYSLPQRVNNKSSCSHHSSHRLNEQSQHVSCSPPRINCVLSTSLNSHSRAHCGPPHHRSPIRTKHGSPHLPQSPQRMHYESPYSSLSPKRYHGSNLTSSPQSVNYEQIDNRIISNDSQSPEIESKFFPSLYSRNNVNHSPQERTVAHTTKGCHATLSSNSSNKEAIYPNVDHSQMPETINGILPCVIEGNSKRDCSSKAHEVHEKGSANKYFPSSSSDQSVSSTLSRVAEYVLSCSDFSSHCKVDSTEPLGAEKENLPPLENVSKNNISSSSSDSFCTAEDDSNTNSPCSHSADPIQNSTSFNQDSTPSFMGDTLCDQKKDLSQRWHPPTVAKINDFDDTIMTSENSFLTSDRKNFPTEFRNGTVGKDKNLTYSASRNTSELQRKKTELSYGLLQKVWNIKENEALNLDDSLFSTVTVEEFLHTDPESGIMLVEKRLPSEYGSSIVSCRRSLDSLSSKLSHDSQATLIYDWKTLKKASRLDSCDDSIHKDFERNNDNAEDTVVPLHLKKLSNEQLSQELQKFGEIPGPVIAATRQVYLRRLASLESDPGLVRITKTCPDYPCEMRQAMNGSFDWSGLSDLEIKMVDNFTNTQGRQWREGCVKSSFTYLLLDPRVTSNLPLRVKDLSELEVFKNFVCAIFYIGKGKRARPYCHLYEAVSKMKLENCKRSDKVQHILDIWNDNLGIISLHCFQSVIPVEAYTREACMLEAIGMHKITNVKRGDCYGIVSTWPMHQRRKLGVYLLHKAMKIFLAEGERQICLPDLKSSSQ